MNEAEKAVDKALIEVGRAVANLLRVLPPLLDSFLEKKTKELAE